MARCAFTSCMLPQAPGTANSNAPQASGPSNAQARPSPFSASVPHAVTAALGAAGAAGAVALPATGSSRLGRGESARIGSGDVGIGAALGSTNAEPSFTTTTYVSTTALLTLPSSPRIGRKKSCKASFRFPAAQDRCQYTSACGCVYDTSRVCVRVCVCVLQLWKGNLQLKAVGPLSSVLNSEDLLLTQVKATSVYPHPSAVALYRDMVKHKTLDVRLVSIRSVANKAGGPGEDGTQLKDVITRTAAL